MASWCATPASDLTAGMAEPTLRTAGRARAVLWCRLGLLLLTLVAFAPALANGFTNYDDPAYVTANPQVRAGLSAAGVAWAFGALVYANSHPLPPLSHLLDSPLFGPHPHGPPS